LHLTVNTQSILTCRRHKHFSRSPCQPKLAERERDRAAPAELLLARAERATDIFIEYSTKPKIDDT